MNVSILKIIKSDYVAMLSAVAVVVLPILYIDFAYLGFLKKIFSRGEMSGTEGDASLFLIIALIGVMVGASILFFRVKSIKQHFLKGVEVSARITHKWMHKDRGRIEYTYEYNGNEYNVGNAVHKSVEVAALKEGYLYTAVINPEKPSKALIKELYI